MPAVIGLIGAGRMGRGIAQAFAFGGHEAILIDVKQRTAGEVDALRQACLTEIDSGISTMIRLGAMTARQRGRVIERVHFAGQATAPEALQRCDVLFECVTETIEAKRTAFAASRGIRDDAVIASTTSTILVSELAALVHRPERFLNAHWLNPAFLVPVVELSAHPATCPQALETLEANLRGIGKRPVRCAATPGYIVPRLQSLVLNEAARMIEDGVASPEQIDEAIRFGFGFRYATMGALEFIDFGGLDILYHANRYLEHALGERYRLAPIVERYMAEGRVGLRSGAGFYTYGERDIADRQFEVYRRQFQLLQYLDAAPRVDIALLPEEATCKSAAPAAASNDDRLRPTGD